MSTIEKCTKWRRKMRRTNLILDTDSYKASHYRQYPKGTTKIYSYLESRGGRWDRLVWFGLQYILKILEQGVTRRDGNEANFFFDKHGLPFNYEGWMYIVGDLEGKLPVEIKAVPEGMVVPTHMPLLTIENTDPKVPWLTTYLETMLLRVWYPTTVATESYHIKQLLKEYFEKTADTMTDLPFKLHDFGSRGVSSCESAGIGGMAHLVNFMGSDTVQGVIMAKEVYGEEMAGFSIPAAEHSTITAFGKDHEIEAYKQMIEEFGNPGQRSQWYQIHMI
jgi:nicotinamide phosphoribosyltransferase